MRQFIAVALMLLPVAAAGQNESTWTAMTGTDITDALTDQTLQYKTARQTFYASGKTLYDAGRPSWGYWRVENDQYCSQWPPQDLWACYKMDRRADMLRFVGEGGDVTEAVYGSTP